jgi:hypothetical protein
MIQHVHPPSILVRFMRLLGVFGNSRLGLGAWVGFYRRTSLHLFFIVFLNLKHLVVHRLRSLGRS